MRVILLYALCLLPILSLVGRADERDEVARIAARYKLDSEVTLSDGSRVDLLGSDYAIEVDWSDSGWAESIGQSALYSILADKRPGIILLRRTETSLSAHGRFLTRCRLVCKKHGITLWTADEGDPSVRRVFPPDPFFDQKTKP